jgi:hypothetical protein
MATSFTCAHRMPAMRTLFVQCVQSSEHVPHQKHMQHYKYNWNWVPQLSSACKQAAAFRYHPPRLQPHVLLYNPACRTLRTSKATASKAYLYAAEATPVSYHLIKARYTCSAERH